MRVWGQKQEIRNASFHMESFARAKSAGILRATSDFGSLLLELLSSISNGRCIFRSTAHVRAIRAKSCLSFPSLEVISQSIRVRVPSM